MKDPFANYLLKTLLLLALPTMGFANFNPAPSSSAGVVERPIEKEYEAKPIEPERQIPLIEVDIPKEQLTLPEGRVTTNIQEIEFHGNTVFSSKELRKLLSDYFDKNLSMQDIRQICFVIQQAYANAGYFVARAYPPPQRIAGGVLKIEIMEGWLGNISIEGNKHYKTSFIRSYFSSFAHKPLNYDQFMKAMILLNENSDLSAAAVFVKGEEVGTADMIIKVKDKLPIHLYLDGNNYGTDATTKHRTGGRFDYGNLLMNGDTLSAAAVLGSPVEGLKFFDGIYKFPINRKGGFLELSYLWSDFKVQQLRHLHLKGKSEVATLRYSQALQRTRQINTDIYLSFEYKQIKNFEGNHVNSFDKLRVLSLGFDLDATDGFKGRNVADFRLSCGIPHFLGGLAAVSPHASRPETGNRFVILNANYRRIQSLWKHNFFLLNIAGQASPYKLPLPQQFYIGGIDTVRGYSMATALGDDGYVVNGEFRIPPPFLDGKRVPFSKKKWEEFLQFIFFVDHGGVYLKHGKQENQRNFVALTGVGTGIRLYGPYSFDFSFDIGFPLTEYKRMSTTVLYFKLTWKPF